VLAFDIEPNGYGAVLAINNSLIDDSLRIFLTLMHDLAKTKLMDYSNEWKPVQQEIVKIDSTPLAAKIPEGMIEIPGTRYIMNVNGIEIEGGENRGVDVQMPGEDIARRHHRFIVDISKFYIDRYPVTNREFKKFMDAAHYKPVDKINFLKDWKKGTYPAGWENKPVTWVDIEDARAYAKWAGKRLPHEWEWQYAAQGTDGRSYPWGSDWVAADVPVADTGHELREPDSVSAHPQGKSPFGVEDMVGNVWQWTDEYVDAHTRCAILRGGSYYQPQGSYWYFPQAYKLCEHGKYLLMSPGQNRSGTLGFRCVIDASSSAIINK
jgi:formylglycine-generating enzyme required for sulfatase activity